MANLILEKYSGFMPIMASPLLHPFKQHESTIDFLSKIYSPLARNQKSRGLSLRHYMNRMNVTSGKSANVEALKRRSTLDVLLISHAFDNTDFTAQDPYIGRMIQALDHSDKQYFVCYIDHSLRRDFCLEDLPSSRCILAKRLAFYVEFALILYVYVVFTLVFVKHLITNGLDARSKIIGRLIKTGACCYSITAIRIFIQIRAILKSVKVNNLISTHEGHIWERFVYKAANLGGIPGVIAGYQHSVVGLDNVPLTRKFRDELYNPSHLLASGNALVESLGTKDANTLDNVIVVGSNRQALIRKKKRTSQHSRFKILLVPEGVDCELSVFLHFLKSHSSVNRNQIDFILRLHPNQSSEETRLSLRRQFKQYPNVRISSASLDDDVSDASFVLYRGSAAVFEAISSGLIPIYLKTSGVGPDPLAVIDPSRPEFHLDNSPTDFLNTLASLKEYKVPLAYHNYFTNFDEKSFQAVLFG